MQKKKADVKTVLLLGGILFLVLGLFFEVVILDILGIIALAVYKNLKKQEKKKKEAEKKRAIFQQTGDMAQQPPPPLPKKSPKREFSHPVRKDKPVHEVHRTERNHKEHRVKEAEDFSFGQTAPHMHHEDLYQQARREISNLRNIRHARSELSGRTLSDTVLWHTGGGVCSSVVQVIRQGNLRYPDLSDKELSRKILADEDLMAHLVRSLEWERRTELR